MPTTVTNELKHEIWQLLREYQQSRSENVRNQLVKLNFGLVRKEAHYWTNQCHETYDDLLQVGCLGLIRAIEKFELSRDMPLAPMLFLIFGVKFNTISEIKVSPCEFLGSG